MKISELFFSIQGEGKRTGVPSFFIRTNHCNLRCKFPGGNLCDTPYTSWNPEDKTNLGDVDINLILQKFTEGNVKDVVITGGEPAVQKEELKILCRELKKLNAHITIETNGTMISDFIKYIDLVSISPKLSSSVPFGTEFERSHSKNRINLDSFREYNEHSKRKDFDIQWKFVVCSETDIDEIKDLQLQVGFSNSEVWLMPEGITADEINEKSGMTVQMCLTHGYNFSGRLHINIWGNRRGV
ncbi:MAG: 7-carboxy-7-deazaguanine synthase QueE [Ignavibacteria bacterium]|nr:7-carboxy-7-deazaguanine synthase QueE [Ignavibacteria bacterium]